MSTTTQKFLDRCMDIYNAKPDYALGCSSLKKCDCIGMIKYSLRENGVSFSTTGTNWTMRNQVDNARKITGVSALKVGDVVFKAKDPGDSGYNLPSKYRKGGSAYNGDLKDYCHIGAVKSVSPLRIVHMTGPTAKMDETIGKWKYAAELKKQYISDAEPAPEPSPSPEPEPTPTPETDKAIVWAEKGEWVKMRKEPSTKCNLYEEIHVGSEVTVLVRGYEWTRISFGWRKGWYMMTKFLKTEKT